MSSYGPDEECFTCSFCVSGRCKSQLSILNFSIHRLQFIRILIHIPKGKNCRFIVPARRSGGSLNVPGHGVHWTWADHSLPNTVDFYPYPFILELFLAGGVLFPPLGRKNSAGRSISTLFAAIKGHRTEAISR